MKTTKPAASPSDQEFEQLTKRFEVLNRRKIEAETSLKHAQQHLEQLRQDAREKYGTDDIAELQKKLAAMQAENDSKRKAYKAELDRIETDLQAVESRFQASESALG